MSTCRYLEDRGSSGLILIVHNPANFLGRSLGPCSECPTILELRRPDYQGTL
jgi:hypothetical protein